MKRRIFGMECEYGVAWHGKHRQSPDEVARQIFRGVVHVARSSNVFTKNGARLYLDVGSHPEYATPECDSVKQLIIYDRAGERMLLNLSRKAEKRIIENGNDEGSIYLFKNNTDSAGNSYGCHENYLVTRDVEFGDYVDTLIPFLVTRQIFAGAGKIIGTHNGAKFCLSQRAEHIWEGVSSATTRSRPIINTRDEPHADAEKYRRLHVIVSDSNMSEYTNFLKVATCALLLRLIEETDFVLKPSLENPIRSIREISGDIECKKKVRLSDGRELSALQIQQMYLEEAVAHSRQLDLNEEEKQALIYWEDCLAGIELDPLSLYRKCDWAAKYRIFEQYHKRNSKGSEEAMNLKNPSYAVLDMFYHDIDTERGIYYKLEKAGEVEKLWDSVDLEKNVQEAIQKPPATTRAKVRGDFIKRAMERNREFTVDWVHIKLNDQEQRTVLCKDPFKSHDERVQKLMDYL